MNITGTDFAFVPVSDFEAARRFYGETLGLPLSVDYEQVRGVEYETGNLTLVVMAAEDVGLRFTPSSNALALRVDDVAEARKELEGKGVTFFGDIVDSGVCHQAYFADPDGHNLILHHRYAPRAA
jgi:catechol 2,3-dioxygenase-like lactoylglutathione lyase family enzyme